jgi:Zn-dependent metalloprotease
MAKLPARKSVDRPAKLAFTTPPVQKAALLDLRAATLDQNDQHDNNQHTGDYPDNHGTVHINSSFPQ